MDPYTTFVEPWRRRCPITPNPPAIDDAAHGSEPLSRQALLRSPFTLVTPDGAWYEKTEWVGLAGVDMAKNPPHGMPKSKGFCSVTFTLVHAILLSGAPSPSTEGFLFSILLQRLLFLMG